MHTNASLCNFSALCSIPWRICLPSTFQTLQSDLTLGWVLPLCYPISLLSTSSLARYFSPFQCEPSENQAAESSLSPANSPAQLARCLSPARSLGKKGEGELLPQLHPQDLNISLQAGSMCPHAPACQLVLNC